MGCFSNVFQKESRARLALFGAVIAGLLSFFPHVSAHGQTPAGGGLLASRDELTAAANHAEISATTGSQEQRVQNSMLAVAIRQRLRDGDIHVGDRIIVSFVSDTVHRDTVAVRAERALEISGMFVVPLAGVLRSELQQRVSTEILKYVKATKIEVTPLMRVGVLGAVARPGFFALPSDIPLTDAIMAAGGPIVGAAVDRSTIRRNNQQYRSKGETSKAITRGLTLDQFGLMAGDELVVGERRELSPTKMITLAGAMASAIAVILALASGH